ncbi:hypothetical protein [Acinetobacter sp. YH12063]|uniref:hypothetical protein n=1 Tax=Acinetobacter sp. YH12063 TaxID=2601061 RepID=UPI0015D117FB|nr:hypothetical protein [Acinetobacter sp. YH12063]
MKQKIIFIFLLLLAVVVCFCLWLRWDERIDPRVLKWQQSEISYHSNYTQEPYFNLLGLNAADRFSALNVGRYRYHQDWAFSLLGQEHQNVLGQPLNAKLTREKWSEEQTNLVAEFQQLLVDDPKAASAFVVEHHQVLGALIQQEKVPLQRFNTWLQHADQYRSLSMPSNSAYPDFKYLNQLAILYQINIALNKEDKLDAYMAEYHRLQQILERPISLVERMLIQSWLARYVRIIRNEQLKTGQVVYLEPLSASQLSLRSAAQLEAYGVYAVLKQVQQLSDWNTSLMYWLYLPNQTVNQLFKQYEEAAQLSELSYDSFRMQAGQKQGQYSSWHIKNYLGNTLSNIEGVPWERYVLAGHILNDRIMIFNLLNQGATDLTQLNQNSHGRRFFKKEGMLCAEVPYPREQFRAHNWNILDSCVQL